MEWHGRRAKSAFELTSVGALGGLIFLLVCIVVPARQEARAEVVAAAGADDRPSGNLLFPVPAVSPSVMADTFNDARGDRVHHAVDILAPRHSEVVAVADGGIARLQTSVAGGIGVYQWSAGRRFVYYYAHLQEYAPGLGEGQTVRRGQVLGYVGTTGNAPANTPHLHFAIARVEKKDQWWGGTPIDPFPFWRQRLTRPVEAFDPLRRGASLLYIGVPWKLTLPGFAFERGAPPWQRLRTPSPLFLRDDASPWRASPGTGRNRRTPSSGG